MKKASRGVRNGIRLALAVGAISLLTSQHAAATNLFWSGNGTTQGGAGTWNTATARWATAAAGTPSGTYGVTWNNANVDSAEFGGTGGLVNLAGPITVNTITTDVAGFNIGNSGVATAANTINFTGANAGVNTNYAGGTTTINAVMNGTLVKSGAGRLEMGNIGASQATTNKYVLNGGALTSASIARIGGPSTGGLVQDFMTFNGGGWGISTTNQDTGIQRGITIKSGGAFLGQTASTINFTLSSKITGNEGGNLTIAGSTAGSGSPFIGNFTATAVTATLNSTLNDWDGGLVLNAPTGSTVKLGASGVVPDTAIVSVNASGNVFDLNGFDETVKSINGTAGSLALGVKKLTLAGPSGDTNASILTGTAGAQLVKNGAGSLIMSGSSTAWTGEVVLNNGALGIGSVNSFGDGDAGGQLTINGGTIASNNANARSPVVPQINIGGSFTTDDTFNATPGALTFGTNVTLKASSTITVNAANASASLTISAPIGEDAAGRGITKAGNSLLLFTNGANTYSGPTQIDAGTLSVDADATFGNGTGGLILNGGTLNATASRTVATPNAVSVLANSSITATATGATPIIEFSGTLSGGSGKKITIQDNVNAATQFKVRFSGNTDFTYNGDIDMLTGTGTNLALVQLESFNPVGTTQTFNGVISGTGTFNRSSSGGLAGETVFAGANTYQGATTVNSSTLTVTNATGSGTGTGTVTVTNNVNGSTLNVGNGGTGGSVSGNIVNNGVVNFNRSNNSSYGSPTVAISGTGVVNKKGAGTLSLPNANSHGGGTKQFDGGLNLGDKASLGTGGYTIGDATTSTTLKVSSSANLTGANAVANAVTVAKDFTVEAGSSDLELSGTVALGAVNRTITVDSSNATILSGVISDTGGTGGITKAGSGVLTLSGANTYGTVGVTGTTVTAGKLLVNNTSGSGTGLGDVSVTGGKLGGNGTISGAVTVNGGTMGAGNSIGTLNLAGPLTLTSGTFDWEFSSGTVTPLTPLAADLTNVGGALSIAAATNLAVANLGTNPFGVAPSPFINGTRFTVLSYAGAWNSGTFGNAALNNNYYMLGGQLWKIKYDDTSAGTVNGGAYTNAVTLTAVPEASTFLVIGLGGVFAFAAVRFGKRMGVNVLNV